MKESFACAWHGVVYVFATQRNMRIHGAGAIGAAVFGWLCHISRLEWGLLVLTIFLVLVTEAVNTAVEKAVDVYTDGFHPLARVAKNVAAGAVLLAAVTAVLMGAIIFGPQVIEILP